MSDLVSSYLKTHGCECLKLFLMQFRANGTLALLLNCEFGLSPWLNLFSL